MAYKTARRLKLVPSTMERIFGRAAVPSLLAYDRMQHSTCQAADPLNLMAKRLGVTMAKGACAAA